MAIVRMTSEERAGFPGVETVTNFPGHEAGALRHGEKCPHKNASPHVEIRGLYPDCVTAGGVCENCWVIGPLYMETTHVGLVLELGEMNGYDDSDFYAVVWSPEKGCTERVEYASTRGWTYPNGASVDATPETIAAFEAYTVKVRAERAAARAAKEAATPAPGKTLRVVKGRKVPKGTVGACVWYGEGKKYGYGSRVPMRVGLKTADGTVHWTDASNVEVVTAAA